MREGERGEPGYPPVGSRGGQGGAGGMGGEGVVGRAGPPGPEGPAGPRRPEPIHPWRWRFLGVWIFIFTFLVFWAVRVNRESIADLKQNKAAVNQLRDTNCALREFILAAQQSRERAAKAEKDPKARANDLNTALVYEKLALSLNNDLCNKRSH